MKPPSKNDQRLLDSTPAEILGRQKVEVRPAKKRPVPRITEEDSQDTLAVVSSADAGLTPVDDEAPPPALIEATCRRYAFKFHRPCKGRGFLLGVGGLRVCSCAAKRMKRRLEAEDAR